MFPNIRGLTSSEAKRLLLENGPNSLPEKSPPSSLSILLSQLKNPLVFVLVAAGVITFLLGDVADTVIILLAVTVNTILGFIQERRAGNALLALKKLVHPTALVIRDGERIEIDSSELVIGDTVVLKQGDKISADGKLISVNRFLVSEAILTGESVPTNKNHDDMIYMGTIVTAGQALMKVTGIGSDTQIGKIAVSVQDVSEETPIKRQLRVFSKQLLIIVLVLASIVFVIGIIRGESMAVMLTVSVALAVSAIPEGLLIGLTVVLAIGMQRILAQKGLVRNLVSAETLGGVTTICTDKTGTLTEGKMQVVATFGNEKEIMTQAILANDLDDPMVNAIWKWANNHLHKSGGKAEDLLNKNKRLDSIPFSSKTRIFTSLHKTSKGNIIYFNGAPEYLIKASTLTNKEKDLIFEEIDKYTKRGMRIIGMGKKTTKKNKLSGKNETSKIEWVGLLALSDPVRQGIKSALEKTKLAGIKTLVITGDFTQTAVFVMHELGIGVDKEEIIEGNDLKNITQEELASKLKNHQVKLFSRTTPEQKLKIIEALKQNGEVVAMMGDGVNDAPALAKADIGIVVADATDVARESADLVLLDSSFSTIVSAIEEGRGMFDNIRKIILYLMSDAFGEIVVVVGALILGLPLPITAAQILWINLVSDGFPDLALTIDPKRSNLMTMPPRHSTDPLVSSWMQKVIFIVSMFGGLAAFGLFIYYYRSTGDLSLSRSIAFVALGVNSLVYVFSIKTFRNPFWKENIFNNKWLLVAVLAGLALQISPFVISPLGRFLGVTALLPIHWLLVFVASVAMFGIIELSKFIIKE